MRAVIRKTSNSVTALSLAGVGGALRVTASYSGSTLASRSADVSFLPTDANYIGRVFPIDRRDVRTTGGDPLYVGVTYGLYVDCVTKDVACSVSSASAVAFTSQVVG